MTEIEELRARVEWLEATQHAHIDTSHLSKEERDQILQELAKPARVFATAEVAPIVVPSSPAGSLVDRVQLSIDDRLAGDEARAAILEVAEWLAQSGWGEASDALLRQEAKR